MISKILPLMNIKILKLFLLILMGWYFFKLINQHKIYFDSLYLEIYNLKIQYIFMAIILYFCSIFFRLLRWATLFKEQDSRHIIKSYLSGFLSNLIMPAKLGEIWRIESCKNLFNVSAGYAIGKILLEKLFDLYFVSILFCVSVLFVFKIDSFDKVPGYLIFINVIMFCSLIFLKNYNLTFGFEKINDLYDNFKQAIYSISLRELPLILFLTTTIWVLDCTSLFFLVKSFGVTLMVMPLLLLFSSFSVVSAVPLLPANIGTYQAVFCVVFSFLGLSVNKAIAVATAVQVCFILPTLLLGSFILLCCTLNLRKR